MKEKLPENYFSMFPDRVMLRVDMLEDDLASIAPTLLLLDKSEPYNVPEGYFSLSKKGILDKVISLQKVMAQSGNPKIWLLVSSITAIVALVVYYGFFSPNDDSGNHFASGASVTQDNGEVALLDEVIYDDTDLYYPEALLDLEFPVSGMIINNISDDDLDPFINAILSELSDDEIESLL